MEVSKLEKNKLNQIKERWWHKVRITTAVSCVCITKAWKSNFESLDQRYSWLWSKPSFCGWQDRETEKVYFCPPSWCPSLLLMYCTNAAGWFLSCVVCGGHGGVSSSAVAVMAIPVSRSWASGATVVMMGGSDLMTFNPRGQEQLQPWCYCASPEKGNLTCPCFFPPSLPRYKQAQTRQQRAKCKNQSYCSGILDSRRRLQARQRSLMSRHHRMQCRREFQQLKPLKANLQEKSRGHECLVRAPALLATSSLLPPGHLIPIRVQDLEQVQCN